MRRAAVATVQILENNGRVVLGYVREIGTAGAFPHRPDVRCSSLQTIIYSNVSLLRKFDSAFLEPRARCIGRTSERDENVGPVECTPAGPAPKLEIHVYAGIAVDTENVRP